MRLLGYLMVAMLCLETMAQQGTYKQVKVVKKKGNKRLLKAKCIFSIKEALPEAMFTIGFDMTTMKFKSKHVSVTDKIGYDYEVRTKIDVKPNKAKKFFTSISVMYLGDTPPKGTCSSLRFGDSTSTTQSPSIPPLPYTFEATFITQWDVTEGTRFETLCVFEVNEKLMPQVKNFVIEFSQPVTDFEQWKGEAVSPLGTSGSVFHLVNKYWLNTPKLEMLIHATFSGTVVPTVTCSSDLPEYIPPTTKPPTTKPPTTKPPTTKSPTTKPPTTKPPTTKPPTTKPPTTKPPTTKPVTTQTPGVTSVPVVVQSDWQVNGDLRRFNGRCTFSVTEFKDVDQLTVNLTFDQATQEYEDWSWNGNTNSAEGYWYFRTNKYSIQPPKVQDFDFQLSYIGQAPPTGICYINTTPTGTTKEPPTTQPPGTTKPGTTPKPGTTKQPGTTIETTTIKSGGTFDYNDVLKKSIWFYRAQRSGDLPDVQNDPVPWRGDSALYDGNDVGVDLTGGWYDAGDYVKFNFPISSATAVLAWGLVQWTDAYKAAGQYNQMLDCIKWSLDFFLKCWRPNEQVLYGQVGNGGIDHSKMMRPEDMTSSNMQRPAYKVTSSGGGSDLAGSMVAAFAAGAIAFKDSDAAYSTKLLNAAKSLYVFADNYRGSYTSEISDAGGYYPSSSYKDELVYAAAMLYKATDDEAYLSDAEAFYNSFGFDSQSAWAFDWSDKLMGAKVLLYEATGESKYSNDVMKFLREWRKGGSVKYTPGGLAWRGQWGSLRYSANTAFIALMAADMGVDASTNRNWAQSQIHYMLGDNPRQSSYVVGFGNNPPKKPHHKASTCEPSPAACDWGVFGNGKDNAHVLYGALVGGPGQNDNYVDDRADYIMAEVTCDYNAGFQSSVAGLVHFDIGN